MTTTGARPLRVGLGLFSIALGTAPVLAPGAVARAAGLTTRPRVLGVLRAIGVRELIVGAGLLLRREPGWLWARVAQDAMDLPTAGATTAAKDGEDRARMVRVTAFLFVVAVVDLAAALQATRTSADATRIRNEIGADR